MSFLSEVEAAVLQLSLPRHVSKITRLQANFEKRSGQRTAVVARTGGFRSRALQAQIHADSVAAKRAGAGYRAAPAGNSKHELGAATDLHILKQTSGDAARDARNPYYIMLAEEARKIGLKPGLDFQTGDPDPYHFEEPASIDVLRDEFNARRAKLLTILGVVVVLSLAVLTGRGHAWN